VACVVCDLRRGRRVGRIQDGSRGVDQLETMRVSVRASVTHRLATAAGVGACLFAVAALPQPAVGKDKDKGKPAVTARALDIAVSVGLVPGSGATLNYKGTFTGKPLGHGNVTLGSRLGGGSATVKYVLSTPQGTIRGTGAVTLTYSGSQITYDGTATITKGTGVYRNVHSSGLRISGGGAVAPDHVTLRVAGPVTY
jgi:hypothetical protein